jgi:phosphoribosylformylglycinamidine synthase subunit PurSL
MNIKNLIKINHFLEDIIMENDFSRLEISQNPELWDAKGETIKKRAKDYFNITFDEVHSVRVLSFDKSFESQDEKIIKDKLTDPVSERSIFNAPIYRDFEFDHALLISWKPGVRDNVGATTKEMINSVVGAVNAYSSQYFVFKGGTKKEVEMIGKLMMSNHIVQNYQVVSKNDWNNNEGFGRITPKVIIPHEPGFMVFDKKLMTDKGIAAISDERNLYLNPNDIPVIRKYFSTPDVLERRKKFGLEQLTDIELEYISQARSDHCNHNTFNGKFLYRYIKDGQVIEEKIIENLFKEYISDPTKRIASKKSDVKIILDDNAGARVFNYNSDGTEKNNYVITGETHNSPSNMEAYGGSITGIVGVYRDPLGTGLGAKLIMGAYGYVTGQRDYDGPLEQQLHPRRLQDGIIEGVRDGGNKSGIPTPFGVYIEEPEFIAKSLVYVISCGLMPSQINDRPSEKKRIIPGDLIIMSGGRVGKDGIHGVTASSEILDENTPAGHVQIGDPYTQKKMHDMILEARDLGYIRFITDNGGGGLSSSVGELSRLKNQDLSSGAELYLNKVPLKYSGLDLWEILVSESQERMTLTIEPDSLDDFMALSKKHDVESTVIGKLTNSNALHIKNKKETVAYIETDFLEEEFPQWNFHADFVNADDRGLVEPNLDKLIMEHEKTFKKYLTRPNIASKEWIIRQYDHEVQGGSSIKPLVGIDNDIPSDAVVLRPDLDSRTGFVFTQNVKPRLSKIDTYDMITASIDEAIRSVLAVGGTLDHLSGIDNFCWPCISENKDNPDARHKAGQLVRANFALKDFMNAYEIVLLSGKDSMYCDSKVMNNETKKTQRISNLPSMMFSLVSKVKDVSTCISCDAKESGNLVYIVGEIGDECGGSEYYSMLGEIGRNVPKTNFVEYLTMYKQFEDVRNKEYMESIKVVKDGLATSIFLMAKGGNVGVDIDLSNVKTSDKIKRDDTIMYSESTGCFLVEVRKENKEIFEKEMGQYVSCIGKFNDTGYFKIKGLNGSQIMYENVKELAYVWKSTHSGR